MGNATALGAQSWLQAFTWLAALVAATIAGVSLRRQSLQNRATLLLHLYKSWEELAKQRREYSSFYETTRQASLQQHANLQNKHQVVHFRKAFQEKLSTLRDNNDASFKDYLTLMGFFELLGMYARNGYIPMKDIVQFYKGPVLDLDIAWHDFVIEWQKQAHIAPGLLENALYLMERMRTRSDHPVYYRTAYPVVRLWCKLFRS